MGDWVGDWVSVRVSGCINPIRHHKRPWFVRDVTTRVALVTIVGVGSRDLLRTADISVKVKLPRPAMKAIQVQHWMDRSG